MTWEFEEEFHVPSPLELSQILQVRRLFARMSCCYRHHCACSQPREENRPSGWSDDNTCGCHNTVFLLDFSLSQMSPPLLDRNYLGACLYPSRSSSKNALFMSDAQVVYSAMWLRNLTKGCVLEKTTAELFSLENRTGYSVAISIDPLCSPSAAGFQAYLRVPFSLLSLFRWSPQYNWQHPISSFDALVHAFILDKRVHTKVASGSLRTDAEQIVRLELASAVQVSGLGFYFVEL